MSLRSPRFIDVVQMEGLSMNCSTDPVWYPVTTASEWVRLQNRPVSHDKRAGVRRIGIVDLPDELLELVTSGLDVHARLMLSKTCRRLNRVCSPDLSTEPDQSFLLLRAENYRRHRNKIPCAHCFDMRPGRHLLDCLTPKAHRVFVTTHRNTTKMQLKMQCIICALRTKTIPGKWLLETCFEAVGCPRCKTETDAFCTGCHQCAACLINNPSDRFCGSPCPETGINYPSIWVTERFRPQGLLSTAAWPHTVMMPARHVGYFDMKNCFNNGLHALCLAEDLREVWQPPHQNRSGSILRRFDDVPLELVQAVGIEAYQRPSRRFATASSQGNGF